ncbi:MAG TPA: protease pro-enzyme activation domain-containing protein, partial [Candidatus Baltobacteraceae bacterium]|nr:protease pro-enzyme activation domain-containing protein [Candidatus Baltobacteraceae bacterium]
MKRIGVFTAVLVSTLGLLVMQPADAALARPLALAAMHGTIVGRLPARTPLSLYIRLQGQHENELDGFIAAANTPGSAFYGRFVTPEQYGTYFGASPAAYAQAIATLRLRGFVIDELAPNRTDIVVHAPAALVESFFATPIDLRSERGRIFYANRFEPLMPPSLHAVAVSGLNDYFVHHPLSRQRPYAIVNGSFSWAPADLAAAYDLNPLYQMSPALDGRGVTIANATCGAATPSDLALFQRQFGLPA